MKSYILRDPNAVEPQTPPPKAARAPRLQPVPAVSPDALPGAPAPTRNGPVLFLGLFVRFSDPGQPHDSHFWSPFISPVQ